MPSKFDEDLLAYFTDVEHLRDLFKEVVAAPTLPKRILVVHGVGGVGKSSLLRMFRLHAKSSKTPVAFASGDEAKSAVDVLVDWAEDLKADKVVLSTFIKTWERYRAVQVKVNEQAHKAGRAVDIAGKAASKTAEAAGGALAGAAIGSVIPGIGTVVGSVLGGVLSGMGTEALVDWLRSQGFAKPDIDLLLDPTKELTADFLSDMVTVASKHRIVLMLDTFEQMTALSDWTCGVTQRLPSNVLLVIAGREMVNWDRQWPGWLAQVNAYPLEPMTPDVMRDLVRRYYATMVGGEPDSAQVEAIIRFARGLPIAVTSAVRLWAKYRVQDFEEVKAEVVGDLVRRLREGIPPEMIPVLEAAASVRWFDKPILRAVTAVPDVNAVYDEFRRFPFVKSSKEGLRLHDSVREILDESLQVDDHERHSELHERAAAYFEAQRAKITQEDPEKANREWLYHRVRADEKSGIPTFQKLAEEFIRSSMVGRLRALMNDVNTYPLNGLNSQLWRDYYNARLLHISFRFSDAEEAYIKISENELAEPKLRAYALCDLGQIWTRNYRLAQPGGLERAFSVIGRSQQLGLELDSKLALNFLHLRYAFMFKGELDRAVDALRQQYEFFVGIGDKNGTVSSLDMLKDLYGMLGNWKMAADAEMEGLGILGSMPSNPFLWTRLTGHNIWHKVWSGRYSEAERGMRQALACAEQEDYIEAFPGLYRDLGLILGLQKRWKESEQCFSKSVSIYTEHGEDSAGLGTTFGFWGLILTRHEEFARAEEYLMKSLMIKKELQDANGIPEVQVWIGEMYEMKAGQVHDEERKDYLSLAESYYNQSLDYRWTSRRYFESAALTGLLRVKYSRNEYIDAVNLFTQAEQIAQEYHYNDLMASLHLYKGHIQWSDIVETWPSGFNAAMLSYKRAMLHALSYNRFALDEVVWGDEVSTPLITLISQCSLQEPEGRRMLEGLANWWKTDADEWARAVFDKNLSSEITSVPLAQAEGLARQREPGDGIFQSSLTEIFSRFLV